MTKMAIIIPILFPMIFLLFPDGFLMPFAGSLARALQSVIDGPWFMAHWQRAHDNDLAMVGLHPGSQASRSAIIGES